ncbi:MAG: endonuclease [Roseburia sp.]|nr:endonuclease [Anaeroplasma bactoclasticum]MCM1196255.1 endonuclease [Roseburia sp.]MCM1556858.1 endonuclease [Anaeroplasma bactoclasticum]
MKKFSKIIISFLVLFTLACVIKVQGNAAPSKYFDETFYTQNIPSNYYNDVDTTLTGENFRRMLSPIISKGYVKHSYKTNNEVLKYTDPDPSGNGNIICLYTGQSLAYGSWNKEHVWAKSHGFPTESLDPYSDAHHLRPTLNSINSSRSNSDFGEVSSGSSDSFGNRWTSSTFEPRDEVKGDVARMMFYMATRYGFDGTYNLMLVDSSSTSQSSGNGRFGNLQTLLKWHYQDPVSKEEIYRNNIIYTYYQKNRNPYIDHPEYVDLAYPNSISSSLTVDEAKVNNVIELIGSLPSNVTLEHKTQINTAQTAYNALNSLEKQNVVNYAELSRCLNALKELEESSTPTIDPNTPTTQGDIVIDFTSGISNFGYTSNITFTASEKKFFASNAFCGGAKDLRVGSNKNVSIDTKTGLSGDGSYLEPLFDVENLKSMSLTVTLTYGTISNWYVLFKASGSSTYTEVALGDPGSSKNFTISATLSTPANGRFIIAFIGNKPRAVIGKLSLDTSGDGSITNDDAFLATFVEEQTNASLRLDYNEITGEVNNACLRFGGIIKVSSYNSNAKFGVIVDEEEYANLYEAGNHGATSAIDYVGEEHCVEITPVRVNQYGKEDSNGEYYLFSWVVTNMKDHYQDGLVAVIYVEYDNMLYLGKTVTASLSSVAQGYVESNTFENPIINIALESLYQ